jgi:hypothetical protein
VIWLTVLKAAVWLVALQAVLVAIAAAALRGRNIYKILIAMAFLTVPIAFIADQWIVGQSLTVEGRLFLCLLHLGLGGLFFHFMTLPDRSVTLRILVELYLSPSGALSIDDLSGRYSVRDMIASRLQQLADGNFLSIDTAGRMTLLPRGAAFGRFVTGGRKLFGIGSAN